MTLPKMVKIFHVHVHKMVKIFQDPNPDNGKHINITRSKSKNGKNIPSDQDFTLLFAAATNSFL